MAVPRRYSPHEKEKVMVLPVPTFYQAVSWLASTVGISGWMALWSNWLYSLRHPDPDKPFDSPLKEFSDFVSSLSGFWLFVFNMVVSIAVPLLAALLLQFVPATVFESLEPYWAIIAMLVFAFWQQQRQHALRPKTETTVFANSVNVTNSK